MSESEYKHGPLPKLFLGGLPPTLTERDLDALIRKYGEAKVDLIKKKNSDLNDGYAFIYPATREIANRLLGTELCVGKRVLQFQISQGRKVCEEADPYRLFMRNLPFTVSDEELTEFFRGYCRVRSAYSIKSDNKHSKGYGFIHLYDQDSADRLLTIGNFIIKNFKVTVENYNPQSKLRESTQVHKIQHSEPSRPPIVVKASNLLSYLGNEIGGLSTNSLKIPNYNSKACKLSTKASALQVCHRLCEEDYNYRFNGMTEGHFSKQALIKTNSWIETDAPTVESYSGYVIRNKQLRYGGKQSVGKNEVTLPIPGYSKL